VFCFKALGFTHVLGDGAGARVTWSPPDSQGLSVPPDAIHPERDVENRANRRQQPDKAQPQSSRPVITLVEHRVNRGQHRGQQAETGHEVRPKLSEVIQPVHCRSFTREHWADASFITRALAPGWETMNLLSSPKLSRRRAVRSFRVAAGVA
jgi:hypothetical protein